MNIVYLILARAGSKRVKNKNLRKIKNKSLVEYSIEFAKKVSKIDKIILSTDSEKIRKLGIKKGLFIPELRPKKLSKSNTSSYQSARYEIARYEKINKKIDAIILIQPSTPYRSLRTFKKLKNIFIKDQSKPLISVKKISLRSDKLLKKRKNFITSYDSKKKETVYIPNGAYFFISRNHLIKNKSFFSKKMNFYEIRNLKENIDIDTKDDLFLARKIF